jgi:predicted nucleic acid-binding protein
MPGLVLDCSATIAALLPDERDVASRSVLDEVLAEGALVPVNWSPEVAQALLSAERRGRLPPGERSATLNDLALLPIQIDEETPKRAWRECLALAETQSLTVYDAAYLELAIRERLPLATRDRALAAAATRCGIPVR